MTDTSPDIRLLKDKHQEHMELMLNNLLKDETLSDITIHCRDGSIRAHKVILAAGSPYFKKLFEQHAQHHQVVFVLHGVAVRQLQSLMELIYKGSTEIPVELSDKLCDIAEEFGMKDIIDENKALLNFCFRDTRFKGQKRVTVDFDNENSGETPPSSLPQISPEIKSSEEPPLPVAIVKPKKLPLTPEARRKSNWALKQRKYKCSLCPASFKRASHLSRHQLVHTGERPYGCNQCDKTFSRHDKLKHHIRKTHTLEFMGNMVDGVDNDGYPFEDMGNGIETFEDPPRVTREDLEAFDCDKESIRNQVEEEGELEEESSNSKQELDGEQGNCGQKKGRGRPRKHPSVSRPLLKRPRGRPKINQLALARLALKSSENYDITNMPFGDLEYLTKPLNMDQNEENFEESNNSVEAHLMEPLVEIELDQHGTNNKNLKEELNKPGDGEHQKEQEEQVLHHNSAGEFLQNIGLLENSTVAKMEIGECTISVSSSTGFA
ncbi:hypothetical protein ABEB36_009762 [Hypothenemus hampei]|uniref:Uncharacterized protein n=1 Tax=Hypothenemus hampei TaxID=57062 RepID=A0ABD1EHD3_HYPHA